MRTSESTAELTKALCKAQAVIKAPIKDKTAKAGSFSYSYADLAVVFDSLREPLSANGLAITQVMDREGEGTFLLTRLLHTSGEWIEGAYPIPANLSGQQLGSALTYGRRYSISAIIGIAAEDDEDGALAEKERPKAPPKQDALLDSLKADAVAAQKAGMLAGFREDADVRVRAAMLSPANLAEFRQKIQDLLK